MCCKNIADALVVLTKEADGIAYWRRNLNKDFCLGTQVGGGRPVVVMWEVVQLS